MKKRVERLRGMRDLLPEAHQHQRWVIDQLSTFLAHAGYAPVDTPTLERYHPHWESALRDALNLRPELTLAREELKARQLNLITQRNFLQPDLRLAATYSTVGLGSPPAAAKPKKRARRTASESPIAERMPGTNISANSSGGWKTVTRPLPKLEASSDMAIPL